MDEALQLLLNYLLLHDITTNVINYHKTQHLKTTALLSPVGQEGPAAMKLSVWGLWPCLKAWLEKDTFPAHMDAGPGQVADKYPSFLIKEFSPITPMPSMVHCPE